MDARGSYRIVILARWWILAKARALLLVLAFLISVVPVSCASASAQVDVGPSSGDQVPTASVASEKVLADWTFMVYLDADCNLESDAMDDFLEMSSVGSSTPLNIVVQMDRATGYATDYGDWTTCKRFRVTQGMTPTAANALADLGEVHMGDDATLQAFIEWTITNYPAQKYALILWDHGGGWYAGVCNDNSAGGDSLSMAELEGAISSALLAKSEHLDVIGFDACLMGMVEVAYDLRSHSDAFAFSEETEPGQGWPYDKVLADLKGSLTMSGQQLADAVVNRYAEYYGSSGKETQSSVTSSQMAALGTSVGGFASAMSSNWATVSGQVQAARAQAEEFQYTFYVDAYDLFEKVKAALGTGAVANAAQSAMDAIDAAVSQERHGSQHANAHGLSIYFPSIASDYDQVGYTSGTHFAADLTWDEFLNTYFSTTPGGGAVADDYEPDNVYTSATEILPGEAQVHSIHNSGIDVDWVKFELAAASDVILLTQGTEGDTVIYLYDTAGVPTTPIYSNDDGNGYFSRLDVSLLAGTFYLKIIEYNMNGEITSYAVSLMYPLAGDAYEPDDDYTHASPIALGDSQVHSIGNGGADIDWVTFTLGASTDIRIETSGSSGDTRLFLYEDTGSAPYEIDWDDDTGAGLFSSIDSNGLPAGTYYAMVEEYNNDNEISSYRLDLTELSLNDAYEPDGTYQSSTDLIAGVDQSHSIGDNGDDEDWFMFQLYSQGSVWIETNGSDGDTMMSLFSSSGVPSTEIASDDDSGDGLFSRITVDQLPSDHYYVWIGAFQGVWGAEVIPEYGIVLFTDPSVPLGLNVVSGVSTITVSWSAPMSDGGFAINGYDIYRGTSLGSLSHYRTAASTSFIDSNVMSGSTYYYKVMAATNFGSSVFTEPMSGAITGGAVADHPDAVGTVAASQFENKIVLTWSAPNSHGSAITSYIVYRSEDSSTPEQIGTCAGCSYTDNDVVKGKTYYYWVSAVNGVGEGSRSTSVQATASAATSTGLDPIIIVAIVGIVIAAVAAVLAVALRARKRGVPPMRSRPAQPPVQTAQPSQPARVEESRAPPAMCPSCGAPSSGGGFCGQCGRRL